MGPSSTPTLCCKNNSVFASRGSVRLGEDLLGRHFTIYSDVRHRLYSGKAAITNLKGHPTICMKKRHDILKICYIRRKEYSAPLQSLDRGETCVQKTFYRYNGRAGGLKQTETEGWVIYTAKAASISERILGQCGVSASWHGNLRALPGRPKRRHDGIPTMRRPSFSLLMPRWPLYTTFFNYSLFFCDRNIPLAKYLLAPKKSGNLQIISTDLVMAM